MFQIQIYMESWLIVTMFHTDINDILIKRVKSKIASLSFLKVIGGTHLTAMIPNILTQQIQQQWWMVSNRQ